MSNIIVVTTEIYDNQIYLIKRHLLQIFKSSEYIVPNMTFKIIYLKTMLFFHFIGDVLIPF